MKEGLLARGKDRANDALYTNLPLRHSHEFVPLRTN